MPARGAFDGIASRPSASLRPSEVPACTIRAGQACAGPTAPPTLAWYLASVPRPGLEALVLPGGAGPGCAALPAVWFLRVAPVLYFAPGWSFAGPWCLRLGPAPLVPCRPPGAQGGRGAWRGPRGGGRVSGCRPPGAASLGSSPGPPPLSRLSSFVARPLRVVAAPLWFLSPVHSSSRLMRDFARNVLGSPAASVSFLPKTAYKEKLYTSCNHTTVLHSSSGHAAQGGD